MGLSQSKDTKDTNASSCSSSNMTAGVGWLSCCSYSCSCCILLIVVILMVTGFIALQ